MIPHTAAVQTGYGQTGRVVTWVAALVLTQSSFMGWYAATQPNGVTLSVTGWHTGAIGKLVFFIGLLVMILEALREAGIELPASVPEEYVLIGLGALASVFMLVRLASIPDQFFADAGRGIGLFIGLFAAFGLVAAGLLRVAERPA